MNIIEKQAKLQRELFDIQTKTRRDLSNLNDESVRKYLSVNEEFAGRLPENRDFTVWSEFQREYAETVSTLHQDYMAASGEILKASTDGWNDAVTAAYAPEPVEEAPVAVAAPKRGAKKAAA